MAAIDFPNSPIVGQVFSAAGRQWEWNGESWDSVGSQIAVTSPITYADGTFAFDAVAFAKQENYELFYVKNTTGSSISKGSVVYISGATGDNALISLSRANAESTSSKTLGLVYETIANDNFGYVLTSGKITGVNTSTAVAGDSVWLSADTAGGMVFGLANRPSAPNHMVYLGIVTRAHAQTGEIEVLVQNGYELDELHNVAIASPAPGDIIQLNGSGIWVNKTIADAGIASTNSPSLTSVILSGATREQVYTTNTGFAGYTFDVSTNGAVQYSSANATSNGTVNIRSASGQTLNAFMGNGQSLTIVLLVTNGTTAYYPTAWQIDGSAITPKWITGTSPSSGNASAIDVYTLTIIKTASSTYTVLAQQTKFA